MELWGWLVGYVVLFALLHLVLYYYYLRRDGERSSTPSFTESNYAGTQFAASDRLTGPSEEGESDRDVDRGLEFEGETIDCPYCGARNEADQTFTYCWNCVSALRR